MSTTAKALAFARELIDLWTKEVSTSFASVAQTFEVSTGNPIITLSDGSPAFSEKVVVVRIRPIPWTALTSLVSQARFILPTLLISALRPMAPVTPTF